MKLLFGDLSECRMCEDICPKVDKVVECDRGCKEWYRCMIVKIMEEQ